MKIVICTILAIIGYHLLIGVIIMLNRLGCVKEPFKELV